MKSSLLPKLRRLAAFLCLLPLLGGCAAFGPSYPRLEQLRIVQTLGVDAASSGVRLSLATAQGDRSERDAVCLSADGPTLSTALARAQSLSTEETLFCGHIKQLVVGERVALAPLLHYVGRSADLRLDTPLWLLRDSSAETLLSQAGSGSRGITEILAAAEAELDRRSDARAFTAGRLLQDLQRQGSALACVLDYRSAAERGEDENARTAVISGFAIVQGERVRMYLNKEALLGISLLRNCLGVEQLTLQDRNGSPAVLELRGGGTRLRPVWTEDGSLRGLEIGVKVDAVLLEGDSSGRRDLYLDDLTAKLEAAISEQLRGLLRRSKLLRADYLGLGARVEAAAPLAYRRLSRPFRELLPEIEISLTVQGTIQHEYDME